MSITDSTQRVPKLSPLQEIGEIKPSRLEPAPHFYQDGEKLFKGTYNLVVRSDVARCIYKFSNAPIRAVVSVTSAAGEPSLATTTTSEKNGWLNLSANNFEFSSPKISIKLSQDEPVVTPKAMPAIPAIPPLQKIIYCVKGKTVKKIQAIRPLCPAGFKKR